jgi:hypothetical protein
MDTLGRTALSVGVAMSLELKRSCDADSLYNEEEN